MDWSEEADGNLLDGVQASVCSSLCHLPFDAALRPIAHGHFSFTGWKVLDLKCKDLHLNLIVCSWCDIRVLGFNQFDLAKYFEKLLDV